MPEFLLEYYVARADGAAVARGEARARVAAQELSRGAAPVRILHSIFVPEDETVFYLCEAASVEAIRELATRAELRVERVAEAAPVSMSKPEGGSA